MKKSPTSTLTLNGVSCRFLNNRFSSSLPWGKAPLTVGPMLPPWVKCPVLSSPSQDILLSRQHRGPKMGCHHDVSEPRAVPTLPHPGTRALPAFGKSNSPLFRRCSSTGRCAWPGSQGVVPEVLRSYLCVAVSFVQDARCIPCLFPSPSFSDNLTQSLDVLTWSSGIGSHVERVTLPLANT